MTDKLGKHLELEAKKGKIKENDIKKVPRAK